MGNMSSQCLLGHTSEVTGLEGKQTRHVMSDTCKDLGPQSLKCIQRPSILSPEI